MTTARRGLLDRQAELIQMNIRPLRQALAMLADLDDQTFRGAPPLLGHLKVSSQMRHILEYYECFLQQISSSHIDYDQRKRDESVERSCAAMSRKIEDTIAALENLPQLRGDSLLFVRIEDAGDHQWLDPFVTSSVSRELLTLSSHATHHMALIAAVLHAWKIPVGGDLGVAPSTLRHRENQRDASLAAAVVAA